MGYGGALSVPKLRIVKGVRHHEQENEMSDVRPHSKLRLIYGIVVLENQERWQMGDDAMCTL